jgi:hypothetical protein
VQRKLGDVRRILDYLAAVVAARMTRDLDLAVDDAHRLL